MKVLITGATGFIGASLLNELRNNPELEITGISRKSITNSPEYGNLKWIQGDLSDSKFINSLTENDYSKVYHLAWEGLPDRSSRLSKLNLDLSKNFLNSISKNSNIELNIVGSCLEYGNATGKVDAKAATFGNDEFSLAKIQLHEFVKKLNINYRWYRPFYVFGNGQNPKSLIPTILRNLEFEENIKLNAIENTHDFIAVEDVAQAIYLSSMNNKLFGEINLGTGVLTCVGDIVNAFCVSKGKNFEQKYMPKEGFYADPSILENEIGWKPHYVGIAGILKYFQLSQFK